MWRAVSRFPRRMFPAAASSCSRTCVSITVNQRTNGAKCSARASFSCVADSDHKQEQKPIIEAEKAIADLGESSDDDEYDDDDGMDDGELDTETVKHKAQPKEFEYNEEENNLQRNNNADFNVDSTAIGNELQQVSFQMRRTLHEEHMRRFAQVWADQAQLREKLKRQKRHRRGNKLTAVEKLRDEALRDLSQPSDSRFSLVKQGHMLRRLYWDYVDDLSPRRPFFEELMRFCAQFGHAEEALFLLREMQQRGLNPGIKHFNEVITALTKTQLPRPSPESVRSFLRDIETPLDLLGRDGVSLPVPKASAALLILVLIADGRWLDASKMYARHRAHDPVLDVRKLEKCITVWEQYNSYFPLDKALETLPETDLFRWNVQMLAFAQSQNATAAVTLLRAMRVAEAKRKLSAAGSKIDRDRVAAAQDTTSDQHVERGDGTVDFTLGKDEMELLLPAPDAVTYSFVFRALAATRRSRDLGPRVLEWLIEDRIQLLPVALRYLLEDFGWAHTQDREEYEDAKVLWYRVQELFSIDSKHHKLVREARLAELAELSRAEGAAVGQHSLSSFNSGELLFGGSSSRERWQQLVDHRRKMGSVEDSGARIKQKEELAFFINHVAGLENDHILAARALTRACEFNDLAFANDVWTACHIVSKTKGNELVAKACERYLPMLEGAITNVGMGMPVELGTSCMHLDTQGQLDFLVEREQAVINFTSSAFRQQERLSHDESESQRNRNDAR